MRVTFPLIPAAYTFTVSVQVSGFEAIRLLTHCDRLLCDSCSSGQCFAFGFLQIPPPDGHPCRSANRSPCRADSGLAPPSHPATTTCTGTAPVKALRAMPGACRGSPWRAPFGHTARGPRMRGPYGSGQAAHGFFDSGLKRPGFAGRTCATPTTRRERNAWPRQQVRNHDPFNLSSEPFYIAEIQLLANIDTTGVEVTACGPSITSCPNGYVGT